MTGAEDHSGDAESIESMDGVGEPEGLDDASRSGGESGVTADGESAAPAESSAPRRASRKPAAEGTPRGARRSRAKVDALHAGRAGGAGRPHGPRSGGRRYGEWEPPPHRRDPVDLLEEQAATRVPELVPIRYGRMLVSPFTFYRGAAYLMASDLAAAPRTGLHAQLCGDAHLSNFGAFAAPDRRLVFSINDFDETLPGPFEWDLKRLVASFAVAGRDRGFDDKERQAINRAVTPRLPEGDEGLRGDGHPRALVRAHRRRRHPPAARAAGSTRSRGSGPTRTSQRPGRRTA